MNAPVVAVAYETDGGAATNEAQQPQNLGAKIDALYEKRERKRELEAELKVVKQELEALEGELLEAMDAQGLNLARGTLASVSISESEVPQLDDWDAFVKYVKDTDSFHLLERRVATAAWRELHESGEPVPGTTPFKKRRPSVRKIRS